MCIFRTNLFNTHTHTQNRGPMQMVGTNAIEKNKAERIL